MALKTDEIRINLPDIVGKGYGTFWRFKCDMISNPEEAWAEAWAAYHTGANELPDYIRKFIEEVVAK